MQSSKFHSHEQLLIMADAYENQPRSETSVNSLEDICSRLSGDRNLEILIASSATAAVAMTLRAHIDFSENRLVALPTEISEAFQLTYPHVDINKLATLGDSDRMSYVNGLVGKLFEIRVRNALNAGREVGGLKLEQGQIAQLAEKANQQGWDLKIVPSNELFQLKCSNDFYYMVSRFSTAQKFDSDIEAIFSADAGQVDLDGVYVSDLSSSDLRNEVITSLQTVGENTSEVSEFMREYGDEMLEAFAILGSAVSVYALVKQIKRIYVYYQKGMSFRDIAEREGTSIFGRIFALTPVPYAGRVARTFADRIYFGNRFRTKKRTVGHNLSELLGLMEEHNFDFQDVVRS